ncbi:MAG TPA: hypothetical protein VKA60_16550 [Blastocatellia bacterium]|nr:hypothetical protein [Blastocatellia bacterium]
MSRAAGFASVINAGTHRGAITIAIVGDTTETATAALNASGSGSASYTSISIQPSGGAARTISGALSAGSPLINLNGADNVTIDGLNTGGNSLTLSNTSTGSTTGTPFPFLCCPLDWRFSRRLRLLAVDCPPTPIERCATSSLEAI